MLELRLDKFLKISRLIKRRTVAKEVCDEGRVEVNGRVAKAGLELKIGDELHIKFGSKQLKARVICVPVKINNIKPEEIYELLATD